VNKVNNMFRVLVLLSAVALVAACGFRPRGAMVVPEGLGPLQVVASDPYSPLADGLARALERNGARAAVEGQSAASLKLLSESIGTNPLSVDQFARVREYVIRYRVEFSLDDAQGRRVVDRQVVELSREYSYDANSSAGSPAEQELLQRELRRDMEAAILRRLDIALRPKP
jgi:LPS-assembly lipoprotein